MDQDLEDLIRVWKKGSMLDQFLEDLVRLCYNFQTTNCKIQKAKMLVDFTS